MLVHRPGYLPRNGNRSPFGLRGTAFIYAFAYLFVYFNCISHVGVLSKAISPCTSSCFELHELARISYVLPSSEKLLMT